MRLFVAFDVNDAVREEMRRVRAAVERTLAGQRVAPHVTWVAPEVAHVTLRFLGEVDEDRAAELCHGFERPIDVQAFDVTWQGLGAFPSSGPPRALWIAPHGAEDRLRMLAEAIESRVEPFAGPRDARTFRAHLTIARVRDRGPRLDWRRILAEVPARAVASRIEHVTLYQSRLSSRGPTYTALARALLALRP